MPVSNVKLKNALSAGVATKIQIGGNTYLEIIPKSKRVKEARAVWRMRYIKPTTKKPSKYTIGEYKDDTTDPHHVSMVDALSAAQEAKKLIKQRIDPVEHRKQQVEQQQQEAAEEKQKVIEKTTNTFEKVARDWHQHRRDVLKKWEPKTAYAVMRSLELHVFGVIGDKPMTEITASDALGIIEKMQEEGKTNVVRKVGQRIKAVFEYAQMRELVGGNPAASISSEYAPYEVEHHPTLAAHEIKQFFDDLSTSPSSETLRIAVEFTMRTLARTEEVRYATWPEFDFKNALWTPEPKNRKGNKKHTYPLPTQVIALLKKLRAGHTGKKYLFITYDVSTPMSENGMLDVLKRIGYQGKLTIHGLRGTASTILNEAFGSLLVDKEFNSELIEKALSHGDSDKVRSSYNHSQYLNSLRVLLQYYSDYLDALRAGEDVVLTTEGVRPSEEGAQVIPINRKVV